MNGSRFLGLGVAMWLATGALVAFGQGAPELQEAKRFALVFDDAPFPVNTEIVLSALEKHGMKATFSMVGQYVEMYPELARRIVDEGHEVANHMWSHTPLEDLSEEQFLAELRETQRSIARVTGIEPRLYRPPYGYLPAKYIPLVQAAGLRIVEPTLDSGAWRNPESGVVTRIILDGVTPYSVILAHVSFSRPVREFPHILAELAKSGFRSTTISGLERVIVAGY